MPSSSVTRSPLTKEDFHRYLHQLRPIEAKIRDYVCQVHPRVPPVSEVLGVVAKDPGAFDYPLHRIPVEFRDDYIGCDEDQDVSALYQFRYLPTFVHTHNFLEFVYVAKGTCQFKSGGFTQSMVAGDLCLVSPGVFHSQVTSDDTTVVLLLAVRCTTFVQRFADLLIEQDLLSGFFLEALKGKEEGPILVVSTGEDKEVRRLFLDMYYETCAGLAHHQAMVNAFFHRLVLWMARTYGEKTEVIHPRGTGPDQRITPLLNYLRAHPQHTSLADLAAHSGYSASYVSQLLKEATGMTFTQLARDLRIKEADAWLKDPGITVSQIVEKLGYSDSSHFYKDFRKVHHQAPGRFRTENRFS